MKMPKLSSYKFQNHPASRSVKWSHLSQGWKWSCWYRGSLCISASIEHLHLDVLIGILNIYRIPLQMWTASMLSIHSICLSNEMLLSSCVLYNFDARTHDPHLYALLGCDCILLRQSTCGVLERLVYSTVFCSYDCWCSSIFWWQRNTLSTIPQVMDTSVWNLLEC